MAPKVCRHEKNTDSLKKQQCSINNFKNTNYNYT